MNSGNSNVVGTTNSLSVIRVSLKRGVSVVTKRHTEKRYIVPYCWPLRSMDRPVKNYKLRFAPMKQISPRVIQVRENGESGDDKCIPQQ
jgi:hypothetical protein